MKQSEQEFMENLETADNAPIVVSPYGFKKIKLEGKTYLTPMTEQEYMNALTQLSLLNFEAKPAEMNGINLTCANNPDHVPCYLNSLNMCVNQCCNSYCIKSALPGNAGWWCNCASSK